MARPESCGRMINKDISDDEGFAKLSAPAAALFCLLIPHFNSHGKQNGGPGFIKDEICPRIPYLTIQNIPEYLKEISDHTSVKWFEFNGRYWIHSLKFLSKHQNLRTDKLGIDTLPNYSGTSPELLPNYSGTSPVLVPHEEEVEEEEKKKAKGSPGLTPPVDNSQSEKEKIASSEKPKEPENGNGDFSELQSLVNQVKVKHPKFAVDAWYGRNMRAHPKAIIHVLKSLLKADPEHEYAYIQKALEVENGKYNARDSEADHEIRKKPMPGEMATIGNILSTVMKGATA